MDLLNDHAHDAVTDVLSAAQVHSTVFCLSELGAPWGFRVVGRNVAKFHLVLDGACVLDVDGEDPVDLSAGDLVLLPYGDEHAMRDRPGSPVTRLDEILSDHPVDDNARLSYGGDGPTTRLLCGGFGLRDTMPGPVLSLLPKVLRFDAGKAGVAQWLEPIFAMLQAEATTSAPGAKAVFAKIADVFLTQILRTYLVGAAETGLLALEPLTDASIAAALELMHAEPDRQWTVASLAGEVAMSRTLFTNRFRQLVGDPPMRHLTKVRLARAAGYLATTDLNVFRVARHCGYDSDASLAKAFTREFQLSPGEYRRRATSSPILAAH